MFKFSIFIFVLLFYSLNLLGARVPKLKEKVRYQTTFGNCPSRNVGKLTLKLIKVFEKNRSLREVKQLIVIGKLDKKHFLSDYNIRYNPLKNNLRLDFVCPEPLMKVQIYKENGVDSYEAILVEGGKLFDPTYEVLLREDKKLKTELPFLALPVSELNTELKVQIAHLVERLNPKFRQIIAEVIFNEDKDLTFILSINNLPSSVFFGKNEWEEKLTKLIRIVNYLGERKKIPAVINLTNQQKVVVKFNDKS